MIEMYFYLKTVITQPGFKVLAHLQTLRFFVFVIQSLNCQNTYQNACYGKSIPIRIYL